MSREEVKSYFAYGLLFILAVAWLCLALIPILMVGEIRWREPCLPLLLFEICLLIGIALFALERIVTLLYPLVKDKRGVEWQT